MLKNLSEESKKEFIKSFTEELIKNADKKKKSMPAKIKIREIIENHDKNKKRSFAEEINEREFNDKTIFPISPIVNKQKIIKMPERKPIDIRQQKERFLSKISSLLLPKSNNPQPFPISQLRPSASNKMIDLGKLNILLRDPTVTSIECVGAGKNILVRRLNETRTTNTTLSRSEINAIIQKFSYEAKIPVDQGPFQIAAGVLSISGINSDLTNSKFIISKIYYGR